MYTIKQTHEFIAWLAGLKDRRVQQRLNARLRKATLGNLGDVKPVSESVFDARALWSRLAHVLRPAR